MNPADYTTASVTYNDQTKVYNVTLVPNADSKIKYQINNADPFSIDKDDASITAVTK